MIAQHWIAAICVAAATALAGIGICPAAEPILQVKNPAGRTFDLSIDDLKRLPQKSVKIEESPGVLVDYQAVALHEVLKAAGAPSEKAVRGTALRQYVLVQAADGYQALFALTETDPFFSDRLILLSYLRETKPLSSSEGPLRLIIPTEKRHARWVRQIKRIDLRQAD
jgi:hypothetical protein